MEPVDPQKFVPRSASDIDGPEEVNESIDVSIETG